MNNHSDFEHDSSRSPLSDQNAKRLDNVRKLFKQTVPDQAMVDRLLAGAPEMTMAEAAVYVAGYVDGYAEAMGNEVV